MIFRQTPHPVHAGVFPLDSAAVGRCAVSPFPVSYRYAGVQERFSLAFCITQRLPIYSFLFLGTLASFFPVEWSIAQAFPRGQQSSSILLLRLCVRSLRVSIPLNPGAPRELFRMPSPLPLVEKLLIKDEVCFMKDRSITFSLCSFRFPQVRLVPSPFRRRRLEGLARWAFPGFYTLSVFPMRETIVLRSHDAPRPARLRDSPATES